MSKHFNIPLIFTKNFIIEKQVIHRLKKYVIIWTIKEIPYKKILAITHFAVTYQTLQGVPEEMLKYASQHGVAKINIDTDLRLAMTSTIREFFIEHPEKFDPREYMGPGRTAVKEMVSKKNERRIRYSRSRSRLICFPFKSIEEPS